ncbi:MAG: hypothetical protein IM547_01620 [Chitinophagaceae bacterium]|nr:hypothetical protein [Chitinophagaceae bacterium]
MRNKNDGSLEKMIRRVIAENGEYVQRLRKLGELSGTSVEKMVEFAVRDYLDYMEKIIPDLENGDKR